MAMDYEGFKNEILGLTDVNLSCYKEKQMKRRIDSLITKNKFGLYEDYIKAIRVDMNLLNKFKKYMTINVSEFFRNPEQWEVLEKEIIPLLLNKTRYLNIWSAACSTGEEPYTLVMILNKFLPLCSIRILASDIDMHSIEKAKEGTYSCRSVEKIPRDLLLKYFIKTGDSYRVIDDIKKCVVYNQHNLLKDEYPKMCDLIICRNVLIYFTEEAKVNIYNNLNKALKTAGILFVGSTEQIIFSNKYMLNPVKTFFYEKEDNIQK